MIQGNNRRAQERMGLLNEAPSNPSHKTPQTPIIDRTSVSVGNGDDHSLDDASFSGPGYHQDGVKLGESVVRANGYEINERPIVVVQNFLPSLRSKGGFPIQIDSEPDDTTRSEDS